MKLLILLMCVYFGASIMAGLCWGMAWLLAGTSERGCCPACGKPWERVVEADAERAAILGKSWHDHANDLTQGARQESGGPKAAVGGYVTTGWRQSCSCPPADPIPCTVLDPFAGTFTVGMVAAKYRRNAVGIELNPEYIDLAKKRCSDIQPVML